MAISRHAVTGSNGGAAGSGSAVLVAPAITAGDILITACLYNATVGTSEPNCDNGFSFLGSYPPTGSANQRLVAFWKRATGSEGNVTIDWGAVGDGTASGWAGFYASYSGAAIPSAVSSNNNTSNTAITGTTLTNVPVGAMSIQIGAQYQSTATATNTTTGTNWSEFVDTTNTAATFKAIAGSENSTNSGSVTGATNTWTRTGTANYTLNFFLYPPSGAALFFGSP